MDSRHRKVSLNTLANGGATEIFDYELQRVLENIGDSNTPAEVARKITLEVSIKPDEDRQLGTINIVCKSKLAPVKAVGTAIHMGKQDGQMVAYENNPKQYDFDFEGEKDEHVIDIEEGSDA